MKHRRLAQWKIFYRLGQRSRGVRPRFVQLNQGRFNLGRMQRIGGFLFDPARSPHESEDAAKQDEILLSIVTARRRGLNLADLFASLKKKATFGPGQALHSVARNFFQ